MNSPQGRHLGESRSHYAASGATRISGIGIVTPRRLIVMPKRGRGSVIFDRLKSVQYRSGARRRFAKGFRPCWRLIVTCPTSIRSRAVYRPRDAEQTVLHQVVAIHLEAFLEAVAAAGDGAGLPEFVEREFREFLTCGVFERGVAGFRCEGCAREHLVPVSCKGRAWCPSCGGGRMTERAAHLVDAVLPWVPVRQWVLTAPHRLRYCAWLQLGA